MAEKKVAAGEPAEESILDVLGIGGDSGSANEPAKAPAQAEPTTDDRIKTLLGTIEGLAGRVDQMQGDFMRLASGAPAAITAPIAPTMTEITLDGLPDQAEDPEGFTKGLNARMNESLKANITALTAHQASVAAAAAEQGARGNRLWSDFQESYFDRLEKDLPDTIKDVTPYVETAAKAVAAKATVGVADPAQKARMVDSLMYGTPARFMEDVFTETERVLSPLRAMTGEEAEAAKAAETDANRTGGIEGGTGAAAAKGGGLAEQGTLVQDIEEIQRATGFY